MNIEGSASGSCSHPEVLSDSLAGATSNFGQVVPLTTMVLKKASGFHIPGMSEGP